MEGSSILMWLIVHLLIFIVGMACFIAALVNLLYGQGEQWTRWLLFLLAAAPMTAMVLKIISFF